MAPHSSPAPHPTPTPDPQPTRLCSWATHAHGLLPPPAVLHACTHTCMYTQGYLPPPACTHSIQPAFAIHRFSITTRIQAHMHARTHAHRTHALLLPLPLPRSLQASPPPATSRLQRWMATRPSLAHPTTTSCRPMPPRGFDMPYQLHVAEPTATQISRLAPPPGFAVPCSSNGMTATQSSRIAPPPGFAVANSSGMAATQSSRSKYSFSTL